jgi:hypothetical protein
MNILLDNLKTLKIPANEPTPEGFIYDKSVGYWKHQSSNLPYVEHRDFAAPGTRKKFDVETGEDYKGR